MKCARPAWTMSGCSPRRCQEETGRSSRRPADDLVTCDTVPRTPQEPRQGGAFATEGADQDGNGSRRQKGGPMASMNVIPAHRYSSGADHHLHGDHAPDAERSRKRWCRSPRRRTQAAGRGPLAQRPSSSRCSERMASKNQSKTRPTGTTSARALKTSSSCAPRKSLSSRATTPCRFSRWPARLISCVPRESIRWLDYRPA